MMSIDPFWLRAKLRVKIESNDIPIVYCQDSDCKSAYISGCTDMLRYMSDVIGVDFSSLNPLFNE